VSLRGNYKIQWIATTRKQAWQNASCAPGLTNEVNLRIADERRQTWDGWGGCFNELGWIALSARNSNAPFPPTLFVKLTGVFGG